MDLKKSDGLAFCLRQEDYFRKLKVQLSKDFNDADFDRELQKITLVNSDFLLQTVSRFLSKVFDLSTSDFFDVLYRVDIPEQEFQHQIQSMGIVFDEIALLIVKRELMKILFREKYSE